MSTYKIHYNKNKYLYLSYSLRLGIVLFALVGLVFSTVFVSMQFGLLNVKGTIGERNEFFKTLTVNPIEFSVITKSPTATSCMTQLPDGSIVPSCHWNQSSEWTVIRAGLEKDRETILRVSKETGVSARMIAAAVVPEQLRFFTSERESYKKYFEPLKILGSMSKFSLGVSGMKQETAKKVEQYTIDRNSPFYPGDGYDKLISYPAGINQSTELFNRLTNNDHYYSYLYTALFIKQLQAQWALKGYDIAERPDVIVTLFNIGFAHSNPNPTPEIGGTSIYVNGVSYTFGELGTAFYLSDELNTIFL